MSKTEIITWRIVANQLTRKSDGWFGIPQYEVSTKWEARLERGYQTETRWEHKRFRSLEKALEYYKSIETDNL